MDQKSIFVKMALHGWEQEISRAEKFILGLSDEQWQKQIAPDRNSVIYLVGHLIAVNDGILDILGISEKLYPELTAVFVSNPDRSGLEMPSINDLKTYWQTVHQKLNDSFLSMSADDWFSRHTAMTDQDFEVEPSRNKLSVLLGRTRHLSYHMGQIRLVK